MANLATINNNLLADSGIDPLSVVLGSGTANQIAYWSSGSVIGSLTTATYPSLTELSYVKGVTSSIQTQLDAKLSLSGGIMTGQIVLKEATNSTDYTKGLRFPNDPYGGGGDTSGLRLYADTGVGVEAQVLELYVTNDGAGGSQDRINFYAPSNDLVTINGNKIWNAGNLPSPQSAITLTTTGTSGAATLVGATLNIPQYQSVLTNPVTGTGTANEITYWTGTSTVGSLSTATYPSLTELSYVKGVTSAIQTQIDAKLSLSGGTMTGNINWAQTDRGITWVFNTDGAYIKFYNTGDGDTNSRLEFATLDNNDEYFRWGHVPSGGSFYESMKLVPVSSGNAELTVSGKIIKAGGTSSQYLMADGSVSTLTNPVTGTGTSGYIPKWTSASAIGNSIMQESTNTIQINGNLISIGGSFDPTAGTTWQNAAFRSAVNSSPYGGGFALIDGTAAFVMYTLNSGATFRIGTATTSTSVTTRLQLQNTGRLTLSNYGSGTFTGTVAYNLAVDASGNVIETAGGVVDGSGTANYVPRWQDANTLTNSILYDDGTNVGVGTASPVSKFQVQNGDIRLQSSGGDPSIIFGSFGISTSYPQGKIVLSDGGLYGGNFDFYTKDNGASTNPLNLVMSIKYDGRILINTSTGTGRLVIAQSNSVQPAILLPTDESTIQGPAANTQIRMGANLVLNGSNIATVGTAGSERIRVTSTGFVGINESSPNYRLTVTDSNQYVAGFWNNVANQLATVTVQNTAQSTTGVNTAAATFELVGKAGVSTHGRHAWIGAEGVASATFRTKILFKVRGESNTGYQWSGASEAPTIVTMDGNGQVSFNQYTSSGSFTGTAAGILAFDSSGNIITQSATLYPSGSGTTNYVTKWTGANTLGIGILYDDGTNVSIGTTSTYQRLVNSGHIALTTATAGTDATADVQRSAIGWQAQALNQVLGAFITGLNQGNWGSDIRFFTRPSVGGNASEKLRVTSSSNVISEGSNIILGTNNNSSYTSTTAYTLFIANAGAEGATAQGQIAFGEVNNYGINTTRIGAAITTYFAASYGRLGLVFKTKNTSNDAGPTEKMRLTDDGYLLLNTTSSNGNTLRVNGSGYFDASITAISATANNGSPAAGWFLSGNDASTIWRGALSIQHNSDVTVGAGTSIGISFAPLASTGSNFYGSAAIKAVRPNATANNQDTDLAFWTRAGASNSTTDSEKMRLTSTGNLLINISERLGNNTNTNPLQVYGGVTIAAQSGIYTYATLQYSGVDFLITANAHPANIGTNNIIFRTGTSGGGGPQEWMRIVSNGMVGINTQSPSAKLEVYAGDSTSSVLWGQYIRNGGNAAVTGYGVGLKLKISAESIPNEYYKWAGIAAVAGSAYSNRTDLAIYTAANSTSDPTEKVRITGEGTTTINSTTTESTLGLTSNNGVKLDMVGYGTGFSYPQARIQLTDAGFYGGILTFSTKANGAQANGLNEVLRLTNTQDVGICQTSPTTKLHVYDSTQDRFNIRIESTIANNANKYMGIGFAGESSNTKGAIFFQSYGNSYSRGKMIFALNNTADQSSATPSNAILTLEAGGNATFVSYVTATAYYESSDSRIKTLLDNTIDYSLISNIEARYYEKNGVQELGYFAQDFENILSSAVYKDDKGFLNLSYTQVHTAKIAALEARVKELESQLKNK